jgi:hypothetical protein
MPFPIGLEREEFFMKAYVIAAETVNDPEMFDLYRKEVPRQRSFHSADSSLPVEGT